MDLFFDERLNKNFDLFTTEVGKGMRIMVASEAGKRTTFIIYLPEI